MREASAFSACAPSRQAVFCRFPRPLHTHVPTTKQENLRMVLPLGRQTAAVRRAQKLATLFSGALAISLFISGHTSYESIRPMKRKKHSYRRYSLHTVYSTLREFLARNVPNHH